MRILAAIGIVAALLAASLLLVSRSRGPREASVLHEPRAMDARSKVEMSTPEPSEARPPSNSAPRVEARSEPVALETANSGSADQAEEPAENGFVLVGRVVDEAGAGIEGAAVESVSGAVLATSGPDGSLDTAVGWTPRRFDGRTCVLRVFARGYAMTDLVAPIRPGESTNIGTVTLAPGGEVFGRTTDEDGAPVRASVSLFEDWPSSGRVITERSDVDGHFRLRGVPVCGGTIGGEGAGLSEARSERFELSAGMEIERNLVFQRRAALSVRVVDPEGRPVQGAAISVVRDGRRTARARTDERGEAVLELAKWSGTERIRAADPGERWSPTEPQPIADLGVPVELVFEHSPRLDVLVADEEGNAIPWGHVELFEDEEEGFSSGRALAELGYGGRALHPAGENGIASVLRPRRSFDVRAYAPGFRTTSFGPFDPERLDEPLTVRLARAETVHGFVTFDGSPVAGAEVALIRTEPEGTIRRSPSSDRRMTEDGKGLFVVVDVPFDAYVLPTADLLEAHDATTDARGSFTITSPKEGWYALQVRANGFPRTLVPRRSLAGSSTVRWDVELSRAGAIEGRVRTTTESSEPHVVAASSGDGIVRVVVADEAGRYRVPDLAPGAYQVRPWRLPAATASPLAPGQPTEEDFEGDCVVLPGETTYHDLDLRNRRSVVLECTVIEKSAHVSLYQLAGEDASTRNFLCATRAPADRPLRHELSLAGDYLLSARQGHWTAEHSMNCRPGLNRVRLEPPEETTVTFVHTPGGHAGALFRLAIESEGGWTWSKLVGSSETTLTVPSGTLRLFRRDEAGGLPLFEARALPGVPLEVPWPALPAPDAQAAAQPWSCGPF